MSSSQALTASLEDYLEAIFHIVRRKSAARPKDITERLGVGSSSVTGALRVLAERGLVNYAPYDIVTLTAEGERLAADVVRRHEALKEFFVAVLGIDESVADQGACQMEHALPKAILERLTRFVRFVQNCPRGGKEWLRRFDEACDTGRSAEGRAQCLSECLKEVEQRMVEREGTAKTVSLSELRPGMKAKIVKMSGLGAVHKRLVDMGLTRGATVELVRVAPLGDPVEIRVRGYLLSLRKEEAANVVVEPQ